MAQLHHRTVLITGASRGIGYALARGMAKAGYHVIATDVDEVALAKSVQSLQKQSGGRVTGIASDLRHVDAVTKLADEAQLESGGIDILMNNAVVRHEAPVDEFEIDDWDMALAVNLTAPLWLCRRLIPHMKRVHWGRIINLSSIYSQRATRNRVAYITTKTALLGLTRAVACETAEYGITCNAIAPGTVLTEAIQAKLEGYAAQAGISFAEQSEQYLRGKQLNRRFISYENIVSTALFLCSDGGSDITGADIPVDGGWGIA